MSAKKRERAAMVFDFGHNLAGQIEEVVLGFTNIPVRIRRGFYWEIARLSPAACMRFCLRMTRSIETPPMAPKLAMIGYHTPQP